MLKTAIFVSLAYILTQNIDQIEIVGSKKVIFFISMFEKLISFSFILNHFILKRFKGYSLREVFRSYIL